jgi:hypothetical protein
VIPHVRISHLLPLRRGEEPGLLNPPGGWRGARIYARQAVSSTMR